jgi:hypothetical protein
MMERQDNRRITQSKWRCLNRMIVEHRETSFDYWGHVFPFIAVFLAAGRTSPEGETILT